MEKSLCEKIVYAVTVAFLLFWIAFSGVQTYRVSKYEHQLEQYRNAAQQLTEYQQSIDAGLQSAQECISSATSSVHELREGLRTLEKIFIDLENDNNNLRYYINNIGNGSNKE